jgi:hypothetical protein
MPPGLQFGMNGMVFGRTSGWGNFDFVAQVRDSSGNTSQRSFILVVMGPSLPPVITDAYYKKKKVFLSGSNFEADALVYVDGEALTSWLDGPTLITQKRKQKPGAHLVYVVNPDGKQSQTFQFYIE